MAPRAKRGRDPLFQPSIHTTPGFKIRSFKTRRSDGRVFASEALKPLNTRFEQEVLDILSGEKDFYLEWQKRIAEAASDEELRMLAREAVTSNLSDSAKKIILQLIDRQYDLIRRIKGR